MIDEAKFQDALACYKRDFVSKQWPREKWKWEAVKWFQDHWDMEAEDFAGSGRFCGNVGSFSV